MAETREQEIEFAVGGDAVSGLLTGADRPSACYVLAHGAGAGMRHKFLSQVARGLAERGLATLRYQFPYMEQGRKRPDSPGVAHAAVRAAVAEAARLLPNTPLIAGGKSYGGRMASEAQAEAPLKGVCGLAFLGFPLHPPGQPSDARAAHLSRVQIPMLFLQGARDDFAALDLLKPLVMRLGPLATLELFEGADHSFHAPAKFGRADSETMTEAMDKLARWSARLGK